MGTTVSKVEDCLGIDGIAHETGLEMQVGTSAATSVAAQSDGLTGLDILVGLHQEARQVAVNGLQTIIVTHDHIEAVTAALKAGQTNTA